MRAIGLRFSLIASLAVTLFLFLYIPTNAETCTVPGDVEITSSTRAAARAAGIPDDVNCWNPNNQYAGAQTGEAKEYLRSILCPPDRDNYGGMGPDQTIEKLDAKFAVCAAKFLKAERSSGIDVCVREGARSVQKQQEYVSRDVLACTKGAGCEHPRGIAIDVNVKPNVNSCTSYAPLHQLAGQFGLKFYLGCRDAYHMVPAIGSCTSGGSVPTGTSIPTGSSPIPSTYYDFPAYAQPTASPFSAVPATSFPAYAPTTLPQTAPSTTQSPSQTQTQPQICSPTFSCSNGTMYYQTSSCTTQVYQLCVYGCNGNACKTASSTSSGIDISGGFSSTSSSTGDDANDNDNTNTNTTNISDILSSISVGDMFTATDVGTSAPLSLNPSIFQSSSLHASSTQYPAGTIFATGTIQTYQPVGSKSTFTSQDLVNNPGSVSTTQSPSVVFSVLEGMKNALLGALNFLLSFGR
jgi:hypothetical protein